MPTASKGGAPAFWTRAGLASLCTQQPSTGQARRIAQRCRRITVWWGTPVETRSVFLRLRREGDLQIEEVAEALKRLSALRRSIAEILPTEEVRQTVESMLDKYALRAADAFQLGAAMVYCRGQAPRPVVRVFRPALASRSRRRRVYRAADRRPLIALR